MNKTKDQILLENAYEQIFNKQVVKEQYHIHDLPFDQQVSVNKLIDNGFKVSGYSTKNGQRILTLRKMGIDAVVDNEGFVNDESVDEFLNSFTPSTPEEEPLRGFTNREVERDIAARREQDKMDGFRERKWEAGALHGDDAYNEYSESTISEAKKKINPWAVAKSIAKKKHLGPKKEEEIVKGVKKSAKKYGKKITSEKIKKNK